MSMIQAHYFIGLQKPLAGEKGSDLMAAKWLNHNGKFVEIMTICVYYLFD